MKRLGTPEECVGTYLYLGSNEMSARSSEPGGGLRAETLTKI